MKVDIKIVGEDKMRIIEIGSDGNLAYTDYPLTRTPGMEAIGHKLHEWIRAGADTGLGLKIRATIHCRNLRREISIDQAGGMSIEDIPTLQKDDLNEAEWKQAEEGMAASRERCARRAEGAKA